MSKFDFSQRKIIHDSRKSVILKAGEVRKIPVAMTNNAFLNVTTLTTSSTYETGKGYIVVEGTEYWAKNSSISWLNHDADGKASSIGPVHLPDGHVYIKSTRDCHVVVALMGKEVG